MCLQLAKIWLISVHVRVYSDGYGVPNGVNGGSSSVVVNGSSVSTSGPDAGGHQSHSLLIVDARSYAAAVANRAKGGGCECQGVLHGYPS